MHRVLRVWVRPETERPVEEREELVLVEGEGVVGDHAFGRMRHVTVVFEDDWREATRELGQDVDPAGRRANVLVSGGGGGRLVGARVRLGPTELEVKGVVSPCPVMDQAAPGLMQALRPGARAGVWARVVAGGRVVPGDGLEALPLEESR